MYLALGQLRKVNNFSIWDWRTKHLLWGIKMWAEVETLEQMRTAVNILYKYIGKTVQGNEIRAEARGISKGLEGRVQSLSWVHTELHFMYSLLTAVLSSPTCIYVHLEKLASEESWDFDLSINLFLFCFILLLMSHRQGLLPVTYVNSVQIRTFSISLHKNSYAGIPITECPFVYPWSSVKANCWVSATRVFRKAIGFLLPRPV